MFRKLIPLFFLLFIFSNTFSQKVLVNVFMQNKIAKPVNDTIYYDASKPLAWKDFKGTPDDKHWGGAVTASGYAFDADVKVERGIIYLNIGVYVFFIKSESWKKPNINSDFHLLHEQRHFDITRLGAENFINELVKSKFTKDNYEAILNTVFNKSYDENTALQNKYDEETQHSIKKDKQLQWNDKIAEDLKKVK